MHDSRQAGYKFTHSVLIHCSPQRVREFFHGLDDGTAATTEFLAGHEDDPAWNEGVCDAISEMRQTLL